MESPHFIQKIKQELSKVIIGQDYMIDRLIIGLLSDGHVLIEGVPGLAKTLTIKSLAGTISANFSRIQFTPDLLPADITGTRIFNQQTTQFEVRKGPIFANLILADEINRAPAKVQSALLQAMQEKEVTIGDETFELKEPFMVLATQNPLEQEGTYPLPEAQLDRFMLKLKIDYPGELEEQLIIRNQVLEKPSSALQKVTSPQEILAARQSVKKVNLDEKIEKYIISIVFATRYPEQRGLAELSPLISYGASPRASIYLAMAAKAHAFMNNRDFVKGEDIKAICKDVLRHRVGLTYQAESEKKSTDYITDTILKKVHTP